MSAPVGPVPRVKVCGITRIEDARLALEQGAWALGLIFHPPSPRVITEADAIALRAALPAEARVIGVFVDRPVAEIARVARRVPLQGIQFHGDQTPGEVASIDLPLRYRAFRVGEDFDEASVDAFPPPQPILLDTYRADRPGGTGETFDWEVAARLGRRRDVIVAGGLDPDNIVEAWRTARPWALDVSSGLEARPGEKDPERIRALFDALRSEAGR